MTKPFLRMSKDKTTIIDCHRIPDCNECPFKDECDYYKKEKEGKVTVVAPEKPVGDDKRATA